MLLSIPLSLFESASVRTALTQMNSLSKTDHREEKTLYTKKCLALDGIL